ncbi:hypothetical protein K523DRAFT_256952 [Schizophyllum commune Tattone D]|nr:hypothetical protein K523DRAFT_256952 [Schizophyllum commune Tattone D]
MHHCLSVPEIFYLICECLSRDNQALKALTLCHRGFYSTALATLWKDQTLRSLLRSLPLDIYTDGYGLQTFETLRKLEEQDLERFTFYATLVRRLSVGSLSQEAQSCLYALGRDCRHPVFSRLRYLQWSDVQDAPAHFTLLFLSSSLRHIELHYATSDDAMIVIPHLPSICPDLHGFTLRIAYARNERAEKQGTASSLARHWGDIREYRVPHVKACDVSYLASLPRLEVLSFDECEKDATPMPSLPSSSFSALRSLDIPHARPEYHLHILQSMPSQSLRLSDLRLGWTSRKEAAWPAIIAAIGHSCAHASLTCLQLHSKEDFDAEIIDDFLPEPVALDYASMQPLAAFSNLIELAIEYPSTYALTDGELQQFARGWPRLERLYLTADAHNMHLLPQSLTIRALFHLARHCPLLTFLSLTFDANVNECEEGLVSDAQQHSLSRLDVGLSRISSASLVFRILSPVFPNLRRIMSRTTLDADMWNDEQEAIRMSAWSQVGMDFFRMGIDPDMFTW